MQKKNNFYLKNKFNRQQIYKVISPIFFGGSY